MSRGFQEIPAATCSRYVGSAGAPNPSFVIPGVDLSNVDASFLEHCLRDEMMLQSSTNPTYLTDTQKQLDAHKRLVLIDWLIEVVEEFRLTQETLFLAVSILDRYLSVQEVSRAQLQLVGITSLWLACKYEEVQPPLLVEFVEMTDNSYSRSDVLAMEGRVLSALRYRLGAPTAATFLQIFLQQEGLITASSSAGDSSRSGGEGSGASSRLGSFSSSSSSLASMCSSGSLGGWVLAALQPQSPAAAMHAQAARQLVHLAEYHLELALLSPSTLRWRPSIVAAAAMEAARSMLGGAAPPRCLSGCLCAWVGQGDPEALAVCVSEMQRMSSWATCTPAPPAVKEKYSSVARLGVSALADQLLGGCSHPQRKLSPAVW